MMLLFCLFSEPPPPVNIVFAPDGSEKIYSNVMSKALVFLVGFLTTATAQGECENNAIVNTSKTVAQEEQYIIAGVCPGLQPLQVQAGTYKKSFTNSSTWQSSHSHAQLGVPQAITPSGPKACLCLTL